MEESSRWMGLAVRRPTLYLWVKKWIFIQSQLFGGKVVLYNRVKEYM